MGAAHNGEDDIAFFAADIGHTFMLAASNVLNQLPDNYGPLPPGRYLIQVVDVLPSTSLVWVCFGKFEAGNPLTGISAGPGAMRVPLSTSAIVAVETHVLKGHNDRLAAIMASGTATVYATLVSRQA